MKEILKKHKGKLAISTGTSGIIIAIIMNFGTISNELQEWFYMAKGETTKPAPMDRPSEDRFTDKPDYFVMRSNGEKRTASKK